MRDTQNRWHCRLLSWSLLVVASLFGSTSLALGAGDREDGEKFFEAEIRPLLVQNCVKCHGPAQQKGGLRLDLKDAALAGGESGPAITPGRPEESLLIEAVRREGLKMPPKEKLSADQVQTLHRWIERGAPWPDHSPRVASSPEFSADDRAWWAIQKLSKPSVPTLAATTWIKNPIDAFVLARLREAGLEPAPEADRMTLLRRLCFDLTGLPPTAELIERFVGDTRPDAYERLVDQLLESPAFGERWARHWLDLVRYAESDGYKADAYRPETYRYRDYVINAFNRDVPYDRFVLEQLAGDELAPGDPAMRVPTTYLRLWPYEYNQRDVEGQLATIQNDLTDVTADVFLGVGLSCARCHNHKFDPILQIDYFRIQAFFTPLIPRDDLPLVSHADAAERSESIAAWEAKTAEIRAKIAALESPHQKAAIKTGIAKFQPHLQAILAKRDAELTPRERQLLYLMKRQFTEEFANNPAANIKGEERREYDRLNKELKALSADRPPPVPMAFTATDVGPGAPPTLVPDRPELGEIDPGFLSLLDPGSAVIETPAPGATTTGRRLALARWLTRDDHPLTARVFANRLWQYHLGRGLVATSSDFGRLGENPTHPALLDWLAASLVESQWSSRQIHRLIVTSATYRQAAQSNPAAAELARRIDPDDRLLWERRPARIEAELVRDAMLAASGELSREIGGPAVDPNRPRRTIYTRQARNQPDPLAAAFDAPDGIASTPVRNVTTTPTQALSLINGAWTLDRAEALAKRLEQSGSADWDSRVDRLYRLALSRPATRADLADAGAFLRAQCQPFGDKDNERRVAEHRALVDLCHVIFNASSFFYVD
jgi:mono/diheme cytochrome c family protein